MVKVRGQNSNRNTVKQTAQNGPKHDDDAAGITSLVPGVENSRLRNSYELPCAILLLQQVAYELIPADQEHFESLAWACMIARWHHWSHNAFTCHVFAVCLTIFPFVLRPRTLTIGFYGKKKLYPIRAYWSAVFLSKKRIKWKWRTVFILLVLSSFPLNLSFVECLCTVKEFNVRRRKISYFSAQNLSYGI